MNNVYKAMVLTAVIMGAMSSVYAAKPDWAGKPESDKEDAKEARSISREERKSARAAERSARNKIVSHLYMYTDIEAPSYDYEASPWGRILVHSKGSWVMLNAHNLQPGQEYIFSSGNSESPIVGTDVANEYGDVHVKIVVPEGTSFVDTSWTLRTTEETDVLFSTETRIMPVKDDAESMEENSAEEYYSADVMSVF